MHKISEVIIVEGRYDKNTLSQIVDATIIETNGFGIFNDKEKQQLLRTIAEKRGIIVMTDPDGAGLVIRNFIKGCVDPKFVKHAYVPEILGKERRKNHAAKEGKLGVEGMDAEAIIRALKCCGATIDDKKATAGESITMADLYAIGFTGRNDSAAKRAAFLSSMNFPSKMTAQTFLPLVNALMSRDEFLEQAF
jgi:ribonuclease M5